MLSKRGSPTKVGGFLMEFLGNSRVFGGLGVKFTEVCTLAPEFWDIPWVQSSVKYGSTPECHLLPTPRTSHYLIVESDLKQIG
jgi:hypothetical protein